MTAVWRSVAFASALTGGDPVVTKPTGTVNGDLLVAYGIATAGHTIAAPDASWNLHSASLATNGRLWWKIASGEPADYTWVVTGGLGNTSMTVVRVDGHDPVNPIDAAAGFAGSGVLVIPAVTSLGSDRLLLQGVSKNGNTTFTPPGTATERWDGLTPNTFVSAGGDEIVGAGSTGSRTWTPAGGGAISIGFMLAIKPAGQVVSPAGYSLTVQYGTPTLIQDQFVNPAGYDLTVQYGTPALTREVNPAGFDITVQYGTPSLSQEVHPDGYDLTVEHGTPTLRQTVAPTGFDLDVEYGDPVVLLDNVLLVTGYDMSVEYGTPILQTQLVFTGVVRNHETGDPISGATIRLFDDNDVKVGTTVTGVDGSYAFYFTPPVTDTFYVTAEYMDGLTQVHGISDRGCVPV